MDICRILRNLSAEIAFLRVRPPHRPSRRLPPGMRFLSGRNRALFEYQTNMYG